MKVQINGPDSFTLSPKTDADSALLEIWWFKYMSAFMAKGNANFLKGPAYITFVFDDPEDQENEGECDD